MKSSKSERNFLPFKKDEKPPLGGFCFIPHSHLRGNLTSNTFSRPKSMAKNARPHLTRKNFIKLHSLFFKTHYVQTVEKLETLIPF
jgi:hypothetical protein